LGSFTLETQSDFEDEISETINKLSVQIDEKWKVFFEDFQTKILLLLPIIQTSLDVVEDLRSE
jgi:hypothetical protein